MFTDCFSGDQSVRLITFSANGEEVQTMVDWCGKNNLVFNVSKTCEMIIDFRKHKKKNGAAIR